jgi:hypothetical protein
MNAVIVGDENVHKKSPLFYIGVSLPAMCDNGGLSRYNFYMLTDLKINDVVRLRKPHPCGSYEWTVIRLGADIRLECRGCRRRIMLPRRELARRLKAVLPQNAPDA